MRRFKSWIIMMFMAIDGLMSRMLNKTEQNPVFLAPPKKFNEKTP